MYAYLFVDHHPEPKDLALIGPPCTQRAVAALERLDSVPTMRLKRYYAAAVDRSRPTLLSNGSH